MSFILNFLGARRPSPGPECPPKVSDDLVVPVPFFDDQDLYRKMFLSFTFQFNSVLDPERLHSALSSVIERPGWKKLGGRIRLESDGKLYLHIPRKFTPERPGVGYAHQQFDCSISEHPLASQIPYVKTDSTTSTQTPQVPHFFPSTSKFRSLTTRPGGPTSLQDLLNSDEPQISLYILNFSDATLVSLTWSHVSLDGMAFSSLLSAWSATLNGQQHIQQAAPHDEDPMQHLGLEENPSHPTRDKILTFWGTIAFILRSLFERLSDPGVESRTVCFPGKWVDKLRQECLSEITTNTTTTTTNNNNDAIGSVTTESPPHLSINDVLTSYLTKTYTTINLSPTQPVVILSLADIRSRLPSYFHTSMVYLSNLLVLSPTFTTSSFLQTSPLGATAANIRHALASQTSDEETVKGTLYFGRKTHSMLPFQKKAPYKTAVVVGSSDAFRTVVTNWDRMRFYDVIDFSAAVVLAAGGCRGDGDGDGDGKLAFYFADTLSGDDNPWRHSWVVFGKDLKGDYWASGWLPRSTWTSVDRDIRDGRIDTVMEYA